MTHQPSKNDDSYRDQTGRCIAWLLKPHMDMYQRCFSGVSLSHFHRLALACKKNRLYLRLYKELAPQTIKTVADLFSCACSRCTNSSEYDKKKNCLVLLWQRRNAFLLSWLLELNGLLYLFDSRYLVPVRQSDSLKYFVNSLVLIKSWVVLHKQCDSLENEDEFQLLCKSVEEGSGGRRRHIPVPNYEFLLDVNDMMIIDPWNKEKVCTPYNLQPEPDAHGRLGMPGAASYFEKNRIAPPEVIYAKPLVEIDHIPHNQLTRTREGSYHVESILPDPDVLSSWQEEEILSKAATPDKIIGTCHSHQMSRAMYGPLPMRESPGVHNDQCWDLGTSSRNFSSKKLVDDSYITMTIPHIRNNLWRFPYSRTSNTLCSPSSEFHFRTCTDSCCAIARNLALNHSTRQFLLCTDKTIHDLTELVASRLVPIISHHRSSPLLSTHPIYTKSLSKSEVLARETFANVSLQEAAERVLSDYGFFFPPEAAKNAVHLSSMAPYCEEMQQAHFARTACCRLNAVPIAKYFYVRVKGTGDIISIHIFLRSCVQQLRDHESQTNIKIMERDNSALGKNLSPLESEAKKRPASPDSKTYHVPTTVIKPEGDSSQKNQTLSATHSQAIMSTSFNKATSQSTEDIGREACLLSKKRRLPGLLKLNRLVKRTDCAVAAHESRSNVSSACLKPKASLQNAVAPPQREFSAPSPLNIPSLLNEPFIPLVYCPSDVAKLLIPTHPSPSDGRLCSKIARNNHITDCPHQLVLTGCSFRGELFTSMPLRESDCEASGDDKLILQTLQHIEDILVWCSEVETHLLSALDFLETNSFYCEAATDRNGRFEVKRNQYAGRESHSNIRTFTSPSTIQILQFPNADSYSGCNVGRVTILHELSGDIIDMQSLAAEAMQISDLLMSMTAPTPSKEDHSLMCDPKSENCGLLVSLTQSPIYCFSRISLPQVRLLCNRFSTLFTRARSLLDHAKAEMATSNPKQNAFPLLLLTMHPERRLSFTPDLFGVMWPSDAVLFIPLTFCRDRVRSGYNFDCSPLLSDLCKLSNSNLESQEDSLGSCGTHPSSSSSCFSAVFNYPAAFQCTSEPQIISFGYCWTNKGPLFTALLVSGQKCDSNVSSVDQPKHRIPCQSAQFDCNAEEGSTDSGSASRIGSPAGSEFLLPGVPVVLSNLSQANNLKSQHDEVIRNISIPISNINSLPRSFVEQWGPSMFAASAISTCTFDAQTPVSNTSTTQRHVSNLIIHMTDRHTITPLTTYMCLKTKKFHSSISLTESIPSEALEPEPLSKAASNSPVNSTRFGNPVLGSGSLDLSGRSFSLFSILEEPLLRNVLASYQSDRLSCQVQENVTSCFARVITLFLNQVNGMKESLVTQNVIGRFLESASRSTGDTHEDPSDMPNLIRRTLKTIAPVSMQWLFDKLPPGSNFPLHMFPSILLSVNDLASGIGDFLAKPSEVFPDFTPGQDQNNSNGARSSQNLSLVPYGVFGRIVDIFVDYESLKWNPFDRSSNDTLHALDARHKHISKSISSPPPTEVLVGTKRDRILQCGDSPFSPTYSKSHEPLSDVRNATPKYSREVKKSSPDVLSTSKTPLYIVLENVQINRMGSLYPSEPGVVSEGISQCGSVKGDQSVGSTYSTRIIVQISTNQLSGKRVQLPVDCIPGALAIFTCLAPLRRVDMLFRATGLSNILCFPATNHAALDSITALKAIGPQRPLPTSPMGNTLSSISALMERNSLSSPTDSQIDPILSTCLEFLTPFTSDPSINNSLALQKANPERPVFRKDEDMENSIKFLQSIMKWMSRCKQRVNDSSNSTKLFSSYPSFMKAPPSHFGNSMNLSRIFREHALYEKPHTISNLSFSPNIKLFFGWSCPRTNQSLFPAMTSMPNLWNSLPLTSMKILHRWFSPSQVFHSLSFVRHFLKDATNLRVASPPMAGTDKVWPCDAFLPAGCINLSSNSLLLQAIERQSNVAIRTRPPEEDQHAFAISRASTQARYGKKFLDQKERDKLFAQLTSSMLNEVFGLNRAPSTCKGDILGYSTGLDQFWELLQVRKALPKKVASQSRKSERDRSRVFTPQCSSNVAYQSLSQEPIISSVLLRLFNVFEALWGASMDLRAMSTNTLDRSPLTAHLYEEQPQKECLSYKSPSVCDPKCNCPCAILLCSVVLPSIPSTYPSLQIQLAALILQITQSAHKCLNETDLARLGSNDDDFSSIFMGMQNQRGSKMTNVVKGITLPSISLLVNEKLMFYEVGDSTQFIMPTFVAMRQYFSQRVSQLVSTLSSLETQLCHILQLLEPSPEEIATNDAIVSDKCKQTMQKSSPRVYWPNFCSELTVTSRNSGKLPALVINPSTSSGSTAQTAFRGLCAIHRSFLSCFETFTTLQLAPVVSSAIFSIKLNVPCSDMTGEAMLTGEERYFWARQPHDPNIPKVSLSSAFSNHNCDLFTEDYPGHTFLASPLVDAYRSICELFDADNGSCRLTKNEAETVSKHAYKEDSSFITLPFYHTSAMRLLPLSKPNVSKLLALTSRQVGCIASTALMSTQKALIVAPHSQEQTTSSRTKIPFSPTDNASSTLTSSSSRIYITDVPFPPYESLLPIFTRGIQDAESPILLRVFKKSVESVAQILHYGIIAAIKYCLDDAQRAKDFTQIVQHFTGCGNFLSINDLFTFAASVYYQVALGDEANLTVPSTYSQESYSSMGQPQLVTICEGKITSWDTIPLLQAIRRKYQSLRGNTEIRIGGSGLIENSVQGDPPPNTTATQSARTDTAKEHIHMESGICALYKRGIRFVSIVLKFLGAMQNQSLLRNHWTRIFFSLLDESEHSRRAHRRFRRTTDANITGAPIHKHQTSRLRTTRDEYIVCPESVLSQPHYSMDDRSLLLLHEMQTFAGTSHLVMQYMPSVDNPLLERLSVEARRELTLLQTLFVICYKYEWKTLLARLRVLESKLQGILAKEQCLESPIPQEGSPSEDAQAVYGKYSALLQRLYRQHSLLDQQSFQSNGITDMTDPKNIDRSHQVSTNSNETVQIERELSSNNKKCDSAVDNGVLAVHPWLSLLCEENFLRVNFEKSTTFFEQDKSCFDAALGPHVLNLNALLSNGSNPSLRMTPIVPLFLVFITELRPLLKEMVSKDNFKSRCACQYVNSQVESIDGNDIPSGDSFRIRSSKCSSQQEVGHCLNDNDNCSFWPLLRSFYFKRANMNAISKETDLSKAGTGQESCAFGGYEDHRDRLREDPYSTSDEHISTFFFTQSLIGSDADDNIHSTSTPVVPLTPVIPAAEERAHQILCFLDRLSKTGIHWMDGWDKAWSAEACFLSTANPSPSQRNTHIKQSDCLGTNDSFRETPSIAFESDYLRFVRKLQSSLSTTGGPNVIFSATPSRVLPDGMNIRSENSPVKRFSKSTYSPLLSPLDRDMVLLPVYFHPICSALRPSEAISSLEVALSRSPLSLRSNVAEVPTVLTNSTTQFVNDFKGLLDWSRAPLAQALLDSLEGNLDKSLGLYAMSKLLNTTASARQSNPTATFLNYVTYYQSFPLHSRLNKPFLYEKEEHDELLRIFKRKWSSIHRIIAFPSKSSPSAFGKSDSKKSRKSTNGASRTMCVTINSSATMKKYSFPPRYSPLLHLDNGGSDGASELPKLFSSPLPHWQSSVTLTSVESDVLVEYLSSQSEHKDRRDTKENRIDLSHAPREQVQNPIPDPLPSSMHVIAYPPTSFREQPATRSSAIEPMDTHDSTNESNSTPLPRRAHASTVPITTQNPVEWNTLFHIRKAVSTVLSSILCNYFTSKIRLIHSLLALVNPSAIGDSHVSEISAFDAIGKELLSTTVVDAFPHVQSQLHGFLRLFFPGQSSQDERILHCIVQMCTYPASSLVGIASVPLRPILLNAHRLCVFKYPTSQPSSSTAPINPDSVAHHSVNRQGKIDSSLFLTPATYSAPSAVLSIVDSFA